MGNRGAPVLVWNFQGAPPAFAGETMLWRSYAAGEGSSSIPAHLETHAERLRAKYLAFIHDLGAAEIDGASVAEHLALGGKFSFWWMNWVAEKSPFKSPGVYASLRLLALEELLREREPARLELATDDADLAEAVLALCAGLGIPAERTGGASLKPPLRERLPWRVRGAASFAKRLIAWRPLTRFREPEWFSGGEAVFIASFFAHIDAEACARGEFHPRYWGPLPGALQGAGRRVNWIHHFVHGYSSDAPDAPTSLAWLDRFNADGERQGRHAFLESYLTFGVILRAARNWLRLCAAHARLRDVSKRFVPKDSAAWLWPFLRADWNNSLSGPVGALNCLWRELFDEILRKIPRQETGLYLCENQAWEAAFLHSWREHGHGRVIGVAHSTVPFWHLYYLDDPRGLSAAGGRPIPDLLAVNGPAARRVFAGVGHPAELLADVEALRYLGLPRLAEKRAASASAPSGETRVLILGDVIAESMRSLLANLEGATKLLARPFRYTFKPHPLYAVDLSGFPGLSIERTTSQGLDGILGEFDVAVAANSTSASIDAHQAGVPVVVGLHGGDLNLSPLRGEPGARFAGTAGEMAAALRESCGAPPATPVRDAFFYLDPALPRWRRLLNLDGDDR